MKMDDMNAIMSAILLNADQKYIGLEAVVMAGQCWMTKDINDKLNERYEVCRSENIHTEVHRSLH